MAAAKNTFDLDLLNSVMKRDNGILIGSYSKLCQTTDIIFVCGCGNQDTKKFRAFVYSCGVKCKVCTNILKNEKKKKTC